MIFFVLSILAIPAGIIIGCVISRNESNEEKAANIIICTVFALLLASMSFVISGLSAPDLTYENLVFKNEITLTYTPNHLFDEIETSSDDNILSFIGSNIKGLYIIKSDAYDEVTLQEYVLRNTFWYFNYLADPYYLLIIPTSVYIEAVP